MGDRQARQYRAATSRQQVIGIARLREREFCVGVDESIQAGMQLNLS
jgi:hypothetical protein